jgi:hypothetical protein
MEMVEAPRMPISLLDSSSHPAGFSSNPGNSSTLAQNGKHFKKPLARTQSWIETGKGHIQPPPSGNGPAMRCYV